MKDLIRYGTVVSQGLLRLFTRHKESPVFAGLFRIMILVFCDHSMDTRLHHPIRKFRDQSLNSPSPEKSIGDKMDDTNAILQLFLQELVFEDLDHELTLVFLRHSSSYTSI